MFQITKYLSCYFGMIFSKKSIQDQISILILTSIEIITLVAMIVTVLFGNSFWIFIPNSIVFFVCVVCSLQFKRRIYDKKGCIILLVFYLFFPLIFFMKDGNNGPVTMYFIMAVICLSFLFSGRKSIVHVLLLITYYIAIIFLGYFYSECVIPYKNDTIKFIDFFISFVTITLLITVLCSTTFQKYYNEYKEVYYLIEKLEEKNDKLKNLSSKDQLSNLYNRRYFLEALVREFALVKDSKNTFYLLMIDIDDFKKINDVYGHLFGDKVIKKVADTIRYCLRDDDVVARYGGDEMTVLLSRMNKEKGSFIAERIRQEVERLKFENESKVTISIGLTKYKRNDNIESIFHRADVLLYQAKKRGKNRVEKEEGK